MFKSHINASSRRSPGSESFSIGFAHQLAIGRPLSAPRTLLAGDFKSIPLRALIEGWWLSTATCLHQRLEPDAQRAPGPAIAGASPALTVSVAQGGGVKPAATQGLRYLPYQCRGTPRPPPGRYLGVRRHAAFTSAVNNLATGTGETRLPRRRYECPTVRGDSSSRSLWRIEK